MGSRGRRFEPGLPHHSRRIHAIPCVCADTFFPISCQTMPSDGAARSKIERMIDTKRSNMTMTIQDVAHLFREYGIPIELRRLADGIASGVYPFGRVVRTSANGRRTFEIWRVDVEAFLRSKIPSEN